MVGNRRDVVGEQLVPRQRSFFELLGAPQDTLTAEDRRALAAASRGFTQGPGFGAGLANASAGFQDARALAEEQRFQRNLQNMERQRQAEQDELRRRQVESGIALDEARIKDIRNPAPRAGTLRAFQQGESFVTTNGQTVREVFNPNTSQTFFENQTTGERLDNLPEGAIRVENSGLNQTNKLNAQAEFDLFDAASDSFGRINQLERARQIVLENPGSIGPEVFKTAARTVTQLTGIQLGDIDNVELGELQQILADEALNAAQRLKGQGQITEKERALLKDSLPKMTTDPQAFSTIIDVLSRAENRTIDLADAWLDADAETRAKGFKEFAFKFRRDLEKQEKASSTVGSSAGDIKFEFE